MVQSNEESGNKRPVMLCLKVNIRLILFDSILSLDFDPYEKLNILIEKINYFKNISRNPKLHLVMLRRLSKKLFLKLLKRTKILTRERSKRARVRRR